MVNAPTVCIVDLFYLVITYTVIYLDCSRLIDYYTYMVAYVIMYDVML